MNDTEATYRMNPLEDTVLFGDELKEGMWVLADNPQLRSPHSDDEDSRLRAQRFRRVTRLRRTPGEIIFVAEWVDGYREVQRCNPNFGWIVKKDPQPEDGTAEL